MLAWGVSGSPTVLRQRAWDYADGMLKDREAAAGSQETPSIEELMRDLACFIEQTDPWSGSKCIVPMMTVEAKRGRNAFFRLRKIIGNWG